MHAGQEGLKKFGILISYLALWAASQRVNMYVLCMFDPIIVFFYKTFKFCWQLIKNLEYFCRIIARVSQDIHYYVLIGYLS